LGRGSLLVRRHKRINPNQGAEEDDPVGVCRQISHFDKKFGAVRRPKPSVQAKQADLEIRE
jgi:hypothetical protein